LEFDQRAAQNAEEGFGDGPLVCGVVGGGQGANALEGEEEVVAVAECVEEGGEAGVAGEFSIIVKL
jgi:hypothetical protein